MITALPGNVTDLLGKPTLRSGFENRLQNACAFQSVPENINNVKYTPQTQWSTTRKELYALNASVSIGFGISRITFSVSQKRQNRGVECGFEKPRRDVFAFCTPDHGKILQSTY